MMASAAQFEARTGLPLFVCAPALEQAQARGLMETAATHLKPTCRASAPERPLELFLPG